MSLQADQSVWQPPAPYDILRWPLPFQGLGNRCLVRGIALLARQQVLSMHGLANIQTVRDPFIIAINHSARTEAIVVPALLFMHRGGRLVHFMADWNYRLIPGIGLMYRQAKTITVTRKSARPRILNVFKPLYQQPPSAFERAQMYLQAGHSVGIFPEGVINRNPGRLMIGRHGVARLSIETGVPVVPAGIRFPKLKAGKAIEDFDVMEVHIGAPLHPPSELDSVQVSDVRAWHGVVMSEIARLSGKSWTPPSWENGNAQQ